MSKPIISVTPEQWDEQYRSGSWDRLKTFTAHYAIIAALVRKYECKSLADIGCGSGILASFLYGNPKYPLEYMGLDISSECRKAHDYMIADASDPKISFKCDCAVFCESLYYMPNPIELVERYLGFAKFAALSISVMPGTEVMIHWFSTCSNLLEDFHLSYGEHEHRIFMLKSRRDDG